MAALQGVSVLLDSTGSVHGVVEQHTSTPLEYDFWAKLSDAPEAEYVVVPKDEAPIDPKDVGCSNPEASVAQPVGQPILQSWLRLQQYAGVERTIAMPNLRWDPMRTKCPEGCVYILDREAKPSTLCAAPFDFGYGWGLGAVEFMHSDPRVTLTDAFFTSDPRLNTLRQELLSSEACHFGVVNEGPSLDAIRPFAVGEDDPILLTYDPDYVEEQWAPRVSSDRGGFLGVYKSDWRTASEHTRRAGAAADGAFKWHLCVKGGPPPNAVDQVVAYCRHNPKGRTWGALADRRQFPELARLEHVGRVARERMIARFFELFHELKRVPGRDTVHTVHESIVPGRVTGMSERAVAYYKGCCMTSAGPGGWLSESPSDGCIIWFQGAPTGDHIGGGAVVQSETASAFPADTGEELGWTKRLLFKFSDHTRCDLAWGFIRLRPVHLIK